MGENLAPESAHEQRVTWGLMAVVVAFVVVMACIVVWITTNLVRSELGSPAGPTPTPSPVLKTTTASPTVSAAPIAAPTRTLSSGSAGAPPMTEAPALVDATWTPVPRPKGRVRYLYWFVKPSKIAPGECVQITWQTENAARLQLFRNGELFLDNAPFNQTIEDCPTQLGYTVYRMVGENSAGEINWIQLQVRVVQP